jgi:hypothetical protein
MSASFSISRPSHLAGVALSTMALLASTLMVQVAAASLSPPARHHSVSATGPSGMDLTDAWNLTTGDPSVLVAYVEGGINWFAPNAKGLVPNIYVNWHELPVPCSGATVATATMVVGGVTQPCTTVYSQNESDYDLDHDGMVNAFEWANDPRVNPNADGAGFLNPDDLIAAFSHPPYQPHADGGVFPYDISGWDFYDNQNDPATTDATYDHANGQMEVIQSECPKCMIMPVKAGDEALDATDRLAEAWLFAYQQGARVIVSVTADLGYSSFMSQVVSYLHSHGVVMLESSNDFNSPDHQGGMFWPYVIPGNGAVATSDGSAWTRSDLTSWGPKNMFTAAGASSTSASTPTLGGDFALLLSYCNLAYSQGLISAPIDGNQAIQIMRATASPVTDPTLPWPGGPGEWNPQYGYGIPDVYKAMEAVKAGQIPPAVSFTSPAWYTPIDPTTTTTVPVTGSVESYNGAAFTWQVQYGLGDDPQSWTTFGTGSGTGSFSGTLGTFNTSAIPQSFWSAPYSLSTTKEVETMEQYTVTFRVVVTDSSGNVGEDRRSVSVVHDPSVVKGFPIDIGASVEGQPALVDLQGTGHLDIVFGTSDGLIEAIDPTTGQELPGWPAHTDPLTPIGLPSSINAGYEPVIAPVAVGDLFHTGNLDVVATSIDGNVYAFDAKGNLLPGWPQPLDISVTPPPIPRPAVPLTRFPVQGATAAPVLVHLSGNQQLQVVQAGMDGYLHAFNPDGSQVAGWPVKVSLPAGFTPANGYELIDDQTLPTAPAVAFLQSPNVPDIVERSQYTEITGTGIEFGSYAIVFAYQPNGQPVPGWPVVLPGVAEYYGSAMGPITEGTDTPVAGPITSPAGPQGATDQVIVNPVFTNAYLLSGSGSQLAQYNGTQPVSPFTSTAALGNFGGQLTYAQSGISLVSMVSSELNPNSGSPIIKQELAFAANGGGSAYSSSGFPAPMQGLDFLGGPVVADVTGTGQDSIIEAGDSSAIQAYQPDGSQAPGFPKFVSSWVIGAPSLGDLFSNGNTDMVAATREGYLYAWSTPGLDSSDNQWWRWRHDEWNSGNYTIDARSPGVARNVQWSPGATTLSFTAPGGDWYSGTVSHYDISLAPSGTVIAVAPSGPAGSTQQVSIPQGTTGVTIQAVNAAGNLGGAVTVGATPPTAANPGLLVATAEGAVSALGSAKSFGSPAQSGLTLAAPIVSMASTPDRSGYWLLGGDGGVFTYGDASFYGSTGGMKLNAPVVGMAPTSDGHGYWLVASDGGIFTFGDAPFYGSTGGMKLNAPVVGMAPTSDGHGYWLVASDGGIFTFGDAPFYGSAAGSGGSFTSVAPTPDGGGYWLVDSAGDVFSYGDAVYFGSAAQTGPPSGSAASVVPTQTANGYWVVTSTGSVLSYGDAASLGAASIPPGDRAVAAAP